MQIMHNVSKRPQHAPSVVQIIPNIPLVSLKQNWATSNHFTVWTFAKMKFITKCIVISLEHELSKIAGE